MSGQDETIVDYAIHNSPDDWIDNYTITDTFMEDTFNWNAFDDMVASYIPIDDFVSKTFEYGPSEWTSYGVYLGYDFMIDSLVGTNDEEQNDYTVDNLQQDYILAQVSQDEQYDGETVNTGAIIASFMDPIITSSIQAAGLDGTIYANIPEYSPEDWIDYLVDDQGFTQGMINTENVDDVLNQYDIGYNLASKLLGYDPVEWLEVGVLVGYDAIANAMSSDSEETEETETTDSSDAYQVSSLAQTGEWNNMGLLPAVLGATIDATLVATDQDDTIVGESILYSPADWIDYALHDDNWYETTLNFSDVDEIIGSYIDSDLPIADEILEETMQNSPKDWVMYGIDYGYDYLVDFVNNKNSDSSDDPQNLILAEQDDNGNQLYSLLATFGGSMVEPIVDSVLYYFVDPDSVVATVVHESPETLINTYTDDPYFVDNWVDIENLDQQIYYSFQYQGMASKAFGYDVIDWTEYLITNSPELFASVSSEVQSYEQAEDNSSLQMLSQAQDDEFSFQGFMEDVIADTYMDVLPDDIDIDDVPIELPFELAQFGTSDLMSSMIYQAIDSGADMMVEEDSITDHALDYSVSDWLDYMTGQEDIMYTITALTPLDEMINEQFGNDDAADTILFSNPKQITADVVSEYALDFSQVYQEDYVSDQLIFIDDDLVTDVQSEDLRDEDLDQTEDQVSHITYIEYTLPTAMAQKHGSSLKQKPSSLL